MGVLQKGREPNHSHPCNAEVKMCGAIIYSREILRGVVLNPELHLKMHGFQARRIATNMLNKLSRTSEKVQPPSLPLGE